MATDTEVTSLIAFDSEPTTLVVFQQEASILIFDRPQGDSMTTTPEEPPEQPDPEPEHHEGTLQLNGEGNAPSQEDENG